MSELIRLGENDGKELQRNWTQIANKNMLLCPMQQ